MWHDPLTIRNGRAQGFLVRHMLTKLSRGALRSRYVNRVDVVSAIIGLLHRCAQAVRSLPYLDRLLGSTPQTIAATRCGEKPLPIVMLVGENSGRG